MPKKTRATPPKKIFDALADSNTDPLTILKPVGVAIQQIEQYKASLSIEQQEERALSAIAGVACKAYELGERWTRPYGVNVVFANQREAVEHVFEDMLQYLYEYGQAELKCDKKHFSIKQAETIIQLILAHIENYFKQCERRERVCLPHLYFLHKTLQRRLDPETINYEINDVRGKGQELFLERIPMDLVGIDVAAEIAIYVSRAYRRKKSVREGLVKYSPIVREISQMIKIYECQLTNEEIINHTDPEPRYIEAMAKFNKRFLDISTIWWAFACGFVSDLADNIADMQECPGMVDHFFYVAVGLLRHIRAGLVEGDQQLAMSVCEKCSRSIKLIVVCPVKGLDWDQEERLTDFLKIVRDQLKSGDIEKVVTEFIDGQSNPVPLLYQALYRAFVVFTKFNELAKTINNYSNDDPELIRKLNAIVQELEFETLILFRMKNKTTTDDWMLLPVRRLLHATLLGLEFLYKKRHGYVLGTRDSMFVTRIGQQLEMLAIMERAYSVWKSLREIFPPIVVSIANEQLYLLMRLGVMREEIAHLSKIQQTSLDFCGFLRSNLEAVKGLQILRVKKLSEQEPPDCLSRYNQLQIDLRLACELLRSEKSEHQDAFQVIRSAAALSFINHNFSSLEMLDDKSIGDISLADNFSMLISVDFINSVGRCAESDSLLFSIINKITNAKTDESVIADFIHIIIDRHQQQLSKAARKKVSDIVKKIQQSARARVNRWGKKPICVTNCFSTESLPLAYSHALAKMAWQIELAFVRDSQQLGGDELLSLIYRYKPFFEHLFDLCRHIMHYFSESIAKYKMIELYEPIIKELQICLSELKLPLLSLHQVFLSALHQIFHSHCQPVTRDVYNLLTRSYLYVRRSLSPHLFTENSTNQFGLTLTSVIQDCDRIHDADQEFGEVISLLLEENLTELEYQIFNGDSPSSGIRLTLWKKSLSDILLQAKAKAEKSKLWHYVAVFSCAEANMVLFNAFSQLQSRSGINLASVLECLEKAIQLLKEYLDKTQPIPAEFLQKYSFDKTLLSKINLTVLNIHNLFYLLSGFSLEHAFRRRFFNLKYDFLCAWSAQIKLSNSLGSMINDYSLIVQSELKEIKSRMKECSEEASAKITKMLLQEEERSRQKRMKRKSRNKAKIVAAAVETHGTSELPESDSVVTEKNQDAYQNAQDLTIADTCQAESEACVQQEHQQHVSEASALPQPQPELLIASQVDLLDSTPSLQKLSWYYYDSTTNDSVLQRMRMLSCWVQLSAIAKEFHVIAFGGLVRDLYHSILPNDIDLLIAEDLPQLERYLDRHNIPYQIQGCFPSQTVSFFMAGWDFDIKPLSLSQFTHEQWTENVAMDLPYSADFMDKIFYDFTRNCLLSPYPECKFYLDNRVIAPYQREAIETFLGYNNTLRILRALYFARARGYKIEERTYQAMRDMSRAINFQSKSVQKRLRQMLLQCGPMIILSDLQQLGAWVDKEEARTELLVATAQLVLRSLECPLSDEARICAVDSVIEYLKDGSGSVLLDYLQTALANFAAAAEPLPLGIWRYSLFAREALSAKSASTGVDKVYSEPKSLDFCRK